jgi:uncharacterized protein
LRVLSAIYATLEIMRLLLAPLLVISACSSPVPAIPPIGERDAGNDGPQQTAADVRIAAYNVNLFFDTVCDSTCAAADFEKVLTDAAFKAKAKRVADALKTLGADVVMLEEVEKEICLSAVQALAPDYLYGAFGETGFKGSIDVGVLSKDPIEKVIKHRGEALKLPSGRVDRFTREFLEVDLDHAGVKYTVFVAHFKSKSSDDPELRLAEAEAARRIVLARAAAEPNRLLVMGGDLNDGPGSPPINALERADAAGQLTRVATRDLAAADQISFRGGFKSAIDHLFVPTALAERHRKGSTKVLGDTPTTGLQGSDHAAIVANFQVTP